MMAAAQRRLKALNDYDYFFSKELAEEEKG